MQIGTRVGAYEVIAKLGEGGMGEVYRARDTKLGREVALKILPDAFAQDHERLARFGREAHILASLNHPRIAQIHGIEESGDRPALVMELVEGDTLADLIARGLAVGDARSIAGQVAEALEAAHEQGIIHRDLKPANVKVRPDGTVKVLDFGLAKASDPQGSTAPLNSPTITSPIEMTAQGLILGTAAYMSPEQARGRPVDKRADIWAFGALLFEMLTHQRLFEGETVSDTLAAVLTRPIDLAQLPPVVSPRVRALVGRCLERDPRRRLRDIGEARVALEQASTDFPASGEIAAVAAPAKSLVPLLLAGIVSALAIGAAVWALVFRGVPTAPLESVELELAPPAGSEFGIGSNMGFPILSPDGQQIAFVARAERGNSLWVRSLARDDARVLPGTEGAFYAFWSPDSAMLGFFAGGKLMTIDVASGLPNGIADAPFGRGGSWSSDGTVLFTPNGGGTVKRVPAGGGAVEDITTLDAARGENAHYWPVALPGGATFLYFVRSTRSDNNGIYLGRVDRSAPPVRVITTLSSGIFVPTRDGRPARLLWVRETDLLAQNFDPSTGQLSGQAVNVASDVRVEESQRLVFASVSHTGLLTWASAAAAEMQFCWYERSGARGDLLSIPRGKIVQPTLSPDGTKLAFVRAAGGGADIWIHEFAAALTTRVSPSLEYDEMPSWSYDGRRLAHQTIVGGRSVSRIVTIDGSAPARIVGGDGRSDQPKFSADGRYLMVWTLGTQSSGDLAAIALEQSGQNETRLALTSDPANENTPAASPDGEWLAFATNRTGRPEIVVTRVSQSGTTFRLDSEWVPVSVEGGDGPHWRGDGRELLYVAPDGHLMTVSVTRAGGTIQLGKPISLFRLPTETSGGFPTSVAPNKEHTRFVVIEAPLANRQTVRVLTNWETRLDVR